MPMEFYQGRPLEPEELEAIRQQIEQFDAIAAYMAKNFGQTEDATKINMNKVRADELVTLIGLTPEEAKALVGFREKHGDFHEWGDMLVIYGVDGQKIEAAKDKMTF